MTVNASLCAEVDLSVYPLTAIKKTCYKLANKCSIRIELISTDRAQITMAPLANEGVRESLMDLFFIELTDQALREQISSETEPVRRLILANAFSKSSLMGE